MSGISEGYGDLSEIEQALVDEDLFFKRAAHSPDVLSVEDAEQEARIAAWLSLEKNSNRAYMNIAAKQRIKAHVYRDQWFGQIVKHGGSNSPLDPLRRRDRDSLDDPDLADLFEAVEGLDHVLLAYHEGEIVQAINSLTEIQREYVVLRFWGGWTDSEIAAMRGVTRSGISAMWHGRIRPQLQQALVYLVAS